MRAVGTLLGLVVLVFFVFLLARLVLDWIQAFARDWRPQGVMLVVAEAVYTVTDPPLKGLRRVIPPVRIGQVSLDLAFMILFIATLLLLRLLT